MSTERLAAELAGFARRQEELLNTIMGRIDRQEQNISTRLTALSRPSEPLNSSGRPHSPILAGSGTQSHEYPVVALNYEETPVSQAPVLSSSAMINDDPQNNGINPRNDHSLQQTENRGAGGGEDAQQEQLPLPPPIPPHDGSQPAQWLGSSAFATSSGQESARPRAVSFQPSDRLGGITFPAQANPDRYQSWGPGNGRNADMEFLRQGLAEVSSRLHRATSSAPEIDRVVEETRLNPFTDRISSSHIRDIGKIKLPEYPGMGDPKAHVRAFRLAIARTHLTYNEQDAGYCRLFAEHLTGPAMEWFSRLRPGSVNSFEQLVTLFLKQYSIFIEHTASEADLWRLTQGPNESLRSYLTRFKEVKSKIANPNNELALEALKNGLRYRSEYRRDLTVNISASLEDALHRGLKFALAEEEDLALAPQQG